MFVMFLILFFFSIPQIIAIGTEVVEFEARPNSTELKNMIMRLLQLSFLFYEAIKFIIF